MVDSAAAAKVAEKLQFLTYALGAIWVVVAAYVGLLTRRLRRAESRLQGIETDDGA